MGVGVGVWSASCYIGARRGLRANARVAVVSVPSGVGEDAINLVWLVLSKQKEKERKKNPPKIPKIKAWR